MDDAAEGPQPNDDSARETVRYASGTVKWHGGRLDGEMHGEWEWYRTDGTLMRTGAFDRGRQVGLWRTYDRAGRPVSKRDHGG